MISDDYVHYFGIDGSRIALGTTIQNLGYLRENVNGRIFSHFFVYLFLSMPKAVFNVCNALNAAVFCVILYRYLRESNNSKNVLLLMPCGILMVWLFNPAFGETCLWLTGACNYSWGFSLYLFILYPFYCFAVGRECKLINDRKIYRSLLYTLAAFVAGAYSENGGAAVTAAMALIVLYKYLITRDRHINLIVMLLAACAGYILLVSAPAMSGRSADISIPVLMDNAKYCITMIQKHCGVLYCIYFALLALGVCCGVEKERIAASVIFFLSGAASALVFCFAAYLPLRGLALNSYLAIFACLILLERLLNKNTDKLLYAGAGVLCALFCFSFILGCGDIVSLYMQSKQRQEIVTSALESGQSIVELPAYAGSTKYTATNHEELSEDPENWYNDFVAKYYGIDWVLGTGYTLERIE